MSGDVQTRQRRKEKRKVKRDSIDQQAILKRLSLTDEPAIGVDTAKITESEKKDVQMHIQEEDHGVGWCAKIVFFTLMAILAGLVVLIVLENRNGSDLDTPLSESRFSEYLQGWVDETREEEHHEEPHFSPDDDHHDDDDGDGEHHETATVPDDEPYPEEKDNSNIDDNNESEELNAEANLNESENDNESQEPNQDDDDGENESTKEVDDDEDESERGDQSPEAENKSDNDEVPSLFEDSTPFEEEKPAVKSRVLEKNVDELYDTLKEIRETLGKLKVPKKNQVKRETKAELKDDNDDDDFESVVDNDAGEDLLLKQLAEQTEAAASAAAAHQQQQSQETDDDEPEVQESSSHRSEDEPAVEVKKADELLSKRRLTILTGSDENLVDEDLENEDIIEVMMVSRPVMDEGEDEEMYTDSELGEEEEYSEEIVDEFESEEIYVPKTFEDYKAAYHAQFETSDEPDESYSQEADVSSPEPQSVDIEMEKRVEEELLKIPEKTVVKESPEIETDEAPISQEEEYEPEEEEELGEAEDFSDEELVDEELLDEEEIEYEEEEEELEESEDLSDIDDDDLMKRLEAKYGKISGENSEDEDDPDGSWTKIPQEEAGGAQSYLEELIHERENLENQPGLKEIYDKAKKLDHQAEKLQSNSKLMEALVMYKDLVVNHGDKLNDTVLKEIGERCIERMRFIGRLKAAVEIHKKLIERFDDEPRYRNQLAVTYLLGNHLSVAKLLLHEILMRWRYDGFALVHYGFVLKNLDNAYEDAALYLREGIDTEEPGTQDGRFFFHLGDALQRIGRNQEAREIYRRGVKLGFFKSELQRSLYNVDRLKSTPFWTKVQTTYKDDLMEIKKYWQIIRDEGLKLLSKEGVFANEAENLKETGDWKQLELYSKGAKTKNCQLAPMTCKVIEQFKAASTCKRGQVKFSVLHPNTHVFSHCGPTNCRVRCHLGLTVPEKTFIRVGDETRSWKEGEWLIFDDSFEHEVWHNGTSLRLVLIVDVWHPELTEEEKRSLSTI